MRVGLLTTGRFWLVDLGRELAKRGHEVRVYSLVPPQRTAMFGLPSECNRWLGPWVAPFYAASKVARGSAFKAAADHALLAALDAVAARLIEPCDVFVAMSGIAVRSLDAVKQRHGATVFLERASRHILSQREILAQIPGVMEPVPEFAVIRELAGYGLADFITVPSQHVADSFCERAFPSERIFRNPFGTSLEVFRPTEAPPPEQPTILMTGSWSLRKGCDVLVEAWRQLPGVRLLHVGPVVDAPLPRDPNFEHVDSVPQHELAKYYAQAHVFVLASREEGLALVQVQAIASGLRLVCTTRTGGEDLRSMMETQDAVIAVPPDDPTRLAIAIRRALSDLPRSGVVRDLLGDARHEFSWEAYARRYESKMVSARA